MTRYGLGLKSTGYSEAWTAATPGRMSIATHPANADRVLAFSLFGEVYISEDAGESWRKVAREFGEIRCLAWLPN